MIRTMRLLDSPAATAILLIAGCASAGAPAADTAAAPTAVQVTSTATDSARRSGYTAADVRFMQAMIGHHAQALTMAALVADRTSRPDFHLMAERITLSQETEIAQMQRWLEQRGEAVPAKDAEVHAAMGHGGVMPGMLTQAELNQLQNAQGAEFERLFLELMIKHHEGALQMVRELTATPGSGREPELFMFAADVDADQTAEIRRMRSLLAQLR